jgi:hypothetical protein
VVIPSGPFTFTVTEAGVTPAALKLIAVVPSALPFTRTPMLVVPAEIVRLERVLAIPVLFDDTLKVMPFGEGAAPESVAVRVAVFPAPTMVSGEGVRATVKPTVIADVAELRPLAETVMVAVPPPTPFTVTAVREVSDPAVMAMDDGVTVATVGSLVVKVRNVVPAETFTRLTGKEAELPGPTVTVAGTLIFTGLATVTPAVAVVTFGLLAWITVVPGATPVTGTVTEVWPAAIVAVPEPTVAALGLVETTVKVMPPKGAGPDRFRVRFWVAVPAIERVGGAKLMLPVTATDFEVEE